MYLFFDTETTGLPTERNADYKKHDVWPRVVSVSWALYKSPEEPLKHDYSIIQPDGFLIPAEATRIHGITNEYALQHGRPLRQVLEELNNDIKAKQPQIIVAHNIAFDLPVLLCEMDRIGMEPILKNLPICCTMLASTDYCAILHKDGVGFKWPRLSELHEKLFGASFSGQHDASSDVLACARCYFELAKLSLTTASPFPFGAEGDFAYPTKVTTWDGADETRILLAAVSEFAEGHPEFNADFVQSLGKQFAQRGFLSVKQFNALRNIVKGWQIFVPTSQEVSAS